jgi:hypothetical protein
VSGVFLRKNPSGLLIVIHAATDLLPKLAEFVQMWNIR